MKKTLLTSIALGILLSVNTATSQSLQESEFLDKGIIEYDSLNQNYPNPTSNETVINYSISTPSEVIIMLYDVTGKLTKQLYKGTQGSGQYLVRVQTSSLNSGVYIYNIRAGRFSASKRMIVSR